MSHNFDKVYDMNQEIIQSEKNITFYENKIIEFEEFYQVLISKKVIIPEEIHSNIMNRLANFKIYIKRNKETVEKAYEYLNQGKRFVDFDDWN